MSTQLETTEIPRDRWQRPLIVPPGGGEPIAYTRVSTMAKALDDLNNLMAWKQRKTAEGLVRRPDLLTRIAGAIANGDPDTDWPTKRELNNVCREATEAAGASKGASSGTGLHALSEAIDRGEEPLFMPDADRARLQTYKKLTRDFIPLGSEVFVVCDALRCAGTFDRVWENTESWAEVVGGTIAPGVRVGDLKTGKSEADYPLATAIQLAIYANSELYDPATGERSPIHPALDKTTGLLVHMPAEGICGIYPLDLEKGWRVARLAAEVHHDIRKWKAGDIIRGGAA